MRPTEELRRAAIGAARDARSLLAGLATEDPALASHVPDVVAALFAAEIGDAAKVLESIEDAMARMHALVEASPEAPAARALRRAMALLHPVRIELARALGRRDEDTAPFLLTSTRIKPSSPPPDERREDDRVELDLEVGLEGDNTFFTGRAGDLSKGGLFVATDEPLPVGTELLLSFVLPDRYRVRAEGIVAWVRAPRYRPDELPAGMGVRFLRLTPKDEHAIQHFLTLRPAIRYGD